MLGKTENRGGSVSNPLEEQKTRKIALPTPWKNEKCHWLRFQPLGRTKNAVRSISNPLESPKTRTIALPTPWKNEKCHWLHFQPLGKIFLTTNFIINL